MASGRRTILLVEDEPAIAEPLAETLTREGFHLEVAGTAAAALEKATAVRPDLILLDLMLPDGSGYDVCREVRRDSQVPIIMLTARGEEADRVIGLELGADDYVVKPFSAREVTARVRAVLRRTAAATAPAGGPDANAAVAASDVRLDPASRTVTKAGAPVEVTRKEFDLLALLMRSAGTVVTRERAHRRGLGRQLVRLDEDARRPRERSAQEARRRLRRAAVHPHGPRRRLHVRPAGGRRRVSLRVWQLAAFAYVLVLMLVALEVPLALNLSKRVDAEVRAQAADQARVVASSAAGRLDQRAALAPIVRTAASAAGGRVIVVDAAGRLLADSADAPAGASYATRPEIRTALAGTVAQGERHSGSLREDILFTAVPIVQSGRREGAVRVTQSLGAVHAEVRRDIAALVGLGVAALVLGLIVAWLLAGFLTRPLRGLTAAARRVEAGDLEARADEAGAREHREVAHAFNDMTARLGRSMTAQRDFVANAAHQLRTPLTGLRLRLEAAGLKTDDDGLRRDLEAGEREAERLARTVTDLLTLARDGQRPAAVAPLALGPAAEAALERWISVAEEHGVDLELRDRSAGARVAASAEDVAVILDNLVENAIEHTAPRTAVVVELGPDGTLAVIDAGPGLAAGEEDRVFERFFRGSSRDDRPRGSGLGLTIVRVLARRWGGDAAIANRPEGGARAVVRVPLATGAAPARDREAVTAVMEDR